MNWSRTNQLIANARLCVAAIVLIALIFSASACDTTSHSQSAGSNAAVFNAGTAHPSSDTLSPTQTAEAFMQRLAINDLDGARSLLFTAANLPPEVEAELRDKLSRMAVSLSKGWRMTVVAERIAGECAMLIAHDQPPSQAPRQKIDLDPMALVQQNGRWLLLLDGYSRPNQNYPLTTVQRECLKELQQWFDNEQPGYQEEIRQAARKE